MMERNETYHCRQPQALSTKSAAPCRILFVEDDADDRYLGKREMEASPLVSEVECFSDAMEFAGYLRAHGFYDRTVMCTPTVIVLDINLPGFSGLRILETLKTDVFLADIPVIIVSAELSYEAMHDAMELGADCICRKPISMDKIAPHLGNAWQRPAKEMP